MFGYEQRFKVQRITNPIQRFYPHVPFSRFDFADQPAVRASDSCQFPDTLRGSYQGPRRLWHALIRLM